jgi:hypothetical protein
MGAIVILGLVLMVPLPSSAGEVATAAPAQPTTSERLIRIGPQALVRQDEHGRVTMVEEFAPEPRKRDVMPAVLGVLFAGMARALFDAFPADVTTSRHPLRALGSGSGSTSE